MHQDSPYQALSETYDAIRPGYPDALIDDVLNQAAPDISRPLLEIGAGTGKATQAFLSRGFCVDAVELEPHMAAHLFKKLDTPKLTLYVSSFETWEALRQDYPLIYCAQAFHWLNPRTKFQKCAQLLAPRGFLGLFWYDPLPPTDSAAYCATEQVKKTYFGPTQHTQTVSLATREQEIRDANDFTLVFQQHYDIVLHNTPEQALMAMQSTPAFAERFDRFPQAKQHQFLTDFTNAVKHNGGTLDAPMRYSLYMLQKTS